MPHDSDIRIRMTGSITHDRFRERVDFVLELARHLHTSGTSVNRLEGAVERVSNKLGLQVSIWSNPTGFIISFQDPVLGPPHTVTRVMRLKPGDTHLGRLSDADAIADAEGCILVHQLVGGETSGRDGCMARKYELERQAPTLNSVYKLRI